LHEVLREEVYFTEGRIIVRGKLVTRGKAKKADFVLYYKPNLPIALIEAKDIRLSDEPQFVCRACGVRGADVRPDFSSGGRAAINKECMRG
jgi:hypothetical protein